MIKLAKVRDSIVIILSEVEKRNAVDKVAKNEDQEGRRSTVIILSLVMNPLKKRIRNWGTQNESQSVRCSLSLSLLINFFNESLTDFKLWLQICEKNILRFSLRKG